MRNLIAALLLIGVVFAQDHPDSKRTKEIQRALNRAGFHLKVDGLWTVATIQALKDIAENNHWQTKSVPDARVLQAIGLGASYSKLLNPESAWTESPYAKSVLPNTPSLARKTASNGFGKAAQPSGVSLLRTTTDVAGAKGWEHQ